MFSGRQQRSYCITECSKSFYRAVRYSLACFPVLFTADPEAVRLKTVLRSTFLCLWGWPVVMYNYIINSSKQRVYSLSVSQTRPRIMGDLKESKRSQKQSPDSEQDHVLFTQAFLYILNKHVDMQQPDMHCFDPAHDKVLLFVDSMIEFSMGNVLWKAQLIKAISYENHLWNQKGQNSKHTVFSRTRAWELISFDVKTKMSERMKIKFHFRHHIDYL